jgi:hypothetical protein
MAPKPWLNRRECPRTPPEPVRCGCTADGPFDRRVASALGSRSSEMIGTLKTMAAAALLAATASMASAAPANMSQVPAGMSGDVVQVHGDHRSCQRGPGGWHRHNRYGERRPCRDGAAKAVVLIPASGSARSGTATIEAGDRHSAGSERPTLRCEGRLFAFALSDDLFTSARPLSHP